MPVPFSPTDYAYMARAIALAEEGRCIATPNPFVGCVLVKNGRVIGEGFTRAGGRPHAEADALARCTESPEGATAYVTLEPCALHSASRGPACSDLLVEAKVARVVAALEDPFHGVNGRGHANLRAAGILVQTGLLEAQVRLQLKAFLARVNRQRPWVVLKVAASLDGATATSSGQSKWITSPEARRDVHALRREACAMLTGIGTVLADNPALTVRDVPCARQPKRVLVDSRLEVPDDAQILVGGEVLVMTAGTYDTADEPRRVARRAALGARGIEVCAVRTEAKKGKIDLVAMMQQLAERKINHVMVETGAKLNGSLLSAGVVDEIVAYFAPSLLGDSGRGMFAIPEIRALADKIQLSFIDVRQVGPDIRVVASVLPTTV